MYKRSEYQIITSRLKEPRKFNQAIMDRKEWGRIFESGGVLFGGSALF